jgi:hypothetical protein
MNGRQPRKVWPKQTGRRTAVAPNPPIDVCCVKGCDAKSSALGMCTRHWRRTKKYGSPVATKGFSGVLVGLPVQERFYFQIKKTPKCWLWAGATDGDGYGIFSGKVGDISYKRAHRFSWSYHTGEVLPPGMMVCHKCDNPRCVNPDHLFAGTARDNMHDMISKGRRRILLGQDSPRAKLTTKQVKSILRDPRPYAQIAAEYDVAATTIGSIKQRVSWSVLKAGPVARAPRIGIRGERNYQARFTEAQIRHIRTTAESGKALAAHFGVTPGAICNIRKRRTWAHVK